MAAYEAKKTEAEAKGERLSADEKVGNFFFFTNKNAVTSDKLKCTF